MQDWIPGYRLDEGPESTGVPLRYVGTREKDGVRAWIRLDGFAPNDVKAAVRMASAYQATAQLEHPDLPAVLDYGSSSIPGRPYIAFQLSTERFDRADTHPVEAAEALADAHVVALDAGLAGVHVPPIEVLRAFVPVEGRRLGVREFLAEIRRPDGLCSLSGVVPQDEWAPLSAPEACHRGKKRASVRHALSYRLAAQLRFACTRQWPMPVSRPARRPADAVPVLEELIEAGLASVPEARPAVEEFLVCSS